MPRIAKTDSIDPHTLTQEAKSALIDDLYRVHCDVFDGVDRESFARYVIDSPAQHTWLHLHRDEGGAIVGYFALHVFERDLSGEPSAVFRAEAGNLRAFRGGGANALIAMRRVLPYVARNRHRRLFYLGSLVHPSSYSLFARLFEVVYPSADHPPPPRLLEFMDQLANSFGLERVHAGDPLVREVHWITRDSEAERSYWQHCEKPAARFFVQRNPGYGEGHGLVTLIPADAAALARVVTLSLKERFDRQKDSLMATLHRLPIGHEVLRPPEVKRLLKGTRLFSGLDERALDRLAETAEKLPLGPGHTVFSEGDPGDDLFVIARGAVYVLINRKSGKAKGEERIVDELAAGAMFGEIAMLSGERRSASVRTASATVLIKISRRALFPLLGERPDLANTIWHRYAERRFDDSVRDIGQFKKLDRAARIALVEAGKHEELAPDEHRTVPPGMLLFVLLGSVRVEQGGSQAVTRAPAIMVASGATPLEVTALAPSRIVLIPHPEGMSEQPLTSLQR